MESHLNEDQIEELLRPSRACSEESTLDREAREEVQTHLQACEGCQSRVREQQRVMERLELIKLTLPSAPSSLCPPDDVWIEVVTGMATYDSVTNLSHASNCDHCGPLLRQALADFSVEVTPEEEVKIAGLKSAGRAWQHNLATQLHFLNPRRSFRFAMRRNQIFLACAAAAALIFAAIFFVSHLGWQPSPDRLLAQAYFERRTLEVRIPGAKYSPLRVERGISDSNLEKPASLLKAEALIAENLKRRPNDPEWLDARAQADLLDGNFDSSIKTLQKALVTEPNSPRLLGDLGAAFYMRAESSDHATDYGNSIESLSKALTKSPDDPLALFNRALACERFFLFNQAEDDWEHYLRVDPNGAWADEARKHLETVRQTLKTRGQRNSEPLLSPRDFLTAVALLNSEARSLVEKRAERYLNLALGSWQTEVPDANPTSTLSSDEALGSLRSLAVILESDHDDTWLTDFLEGPSSSTRNAAVQGLLASDETVDKGLYGHSIELAQQSRREFESEQNQAGMLRASLAEMVAQAFALKFSECLRTAAKVVPLLARTRYRWLQAGTLIEQGECLAGAAKLREAIEANRKGQDLAKNFHYPDLQLRAIAFGASYLINTGDTDEGMRQLSDGLAVFWQSDATNKRGENLYSCLFATSESNNWPYVNSFALGEMLHRFPSRDPVDQAVKREFLAGAQKRTGNYRAAQETLKDAAALLSALPDDKAVVMRRAEIALDDAQIQLELGNANGAVASLAPFRQQFETASQGQFQAEYFKTFGESYLVLGQEEDARPLLQRALTVRETGLRSLLREDDKLLWTRAEGELYRDLLDVKLKLEKPEEAFAWWEWFKGASLRDTTAAGASSSSGLSPSIVVSVNALSHGTTVISYAMSRDSITAFVVRDQTVHLHTLRIPPYFDQLVQQFLRLCADPTTDINLLNTDGFQLYIILIAPLESDFKGTNTIRIETDGIVDQVPFGLLHGPDGRYLGDRFEVTFSEGMPFEVKSHLRPLSDSFSPESPALIVASSGASNFSSPTLPEAEDEGREVASQFKAPTLITGHQVNRSEILAHLRNVEVFHFAGHASAAFDRVGLVLGPRELLDSRGFESVRLRKLRLAVLSACDTANGTEGTSADVTSVTRTLIAAGVPQVIASRWNVDSAVTRKLMRALYSNLVSGETPTESLRRASVAVRSLPEYHHPYYWASFSVFGNS